MDNGNWLTPEELRVAVLMSAQSYKIDRVATELRLHMEVADLVRQIAAAKLRAYKLLDQFHLVRDNPEVTVEQICGILEWARLPGQFRTGESRLTNREVEVLIHLANGLKIKEVAGRLDVSLKTAEAHKTNLMRKIDAHTARDVTAYAIQHGYVEIST